MTPDTHFGGEILWKAETHTTVSQYAGGRAVGRKKRKHEPDSAAVLREIIELLIEQLRRVGELAKGDLTAAEQVRILNAIGLTGIRMMNLTRSQGGEGDERAWWEQLSRLADEVRQEMFHEGEKS